MYVIIRRFWTLEDFGRIAFRVLRRERFCFTGSSRDDATFDPIEKEQFEQWI